MIIKKFILKGLYQRDDLNYNLLFNEDINILTGKNGSGKTTILKLIWYFISGNIERIITDVDFKELYIETDQFSIGLKPYKKIPKKPSKKSKKRKVRYEKKGKNIEEDRIIVKWDFGKGIQEKNLLIGEYEDDGLPHFLNKKVIDLPTKSIFFPTFRRIEGNFIINKLSQGEQAQSLDEAMRIMQRTKVYEEIDKAVYYLSNFFSVQKHRFVTSISADDIAHLLTKHYADVSEKTNALHKKLSNYIVDRTSSSQNNDSTNEVNGLENALTEIQKEAEKINSEINVLLNPFNVIEQNIKKLFQYKGIKVTDSLILGQTESIISSDNLSAGEKQLLSFLCYNAFYNNTIIFIDEPELSLHVDWQRLLIDILFEQNTTNQFIIATHSPFIYSQFPEKEVIIVEDKGDSYIS